MKGTIEDLARRYILAREEVVKARAARARVMSETYEDLDCPCGNGEEGIETTCHQGGLNPDRYCAACLTRLEATQKVQAAANKQGGALRALRHAVLAQEPDVLRAVAQTRKDAAERRESYLFNGPGGRP